MEVKIFTIDDLNFDEGVRAISLVEEPAMEEDYMLFSTDKINVTLAKVDTDQRIITGPAMIPDKKIYRYDRATNEEYYAVFPKETVLQASQLYLKNHNQYNTTLQHEQKIDDVYVIESWIVADANKDKACALGYDVPEGTWMVSMKVDNQDIWDNHVKAGKAKGFSIEGAFAEKFNTQSKPILDLESTINQIELEELVNQIKKSNKMQEIIDYLTGLE